MVLLKTFNSATGSLCVTLLFVLLAPVISSADSLSSQSPINYETAPAEDPIARLQKKINSGQATLDLDNRHGYLPSVLKALNIPASSQTLVFSKTSFQRELIAPWRPRALYFNDDVYVGWVQGGPVLEVASVDKQLGPVFYTLSQGPSKKPQFHRQTDSCLQCHEGSMTHDVPGLMMRSLFTDASGQPLFNAGNYRTTLASPFRQRWGGWYVTGSHGSIRHMGNLVLHASDDPEHPDLEAGANLPSLSSKFDTSSYLAPGSDIVALMVLAHQTQIHNLITNANYQSRLALRDQQAMNEALGEKPNHEFESTGHRIQSACEPLVKGLLFCGEAPLPDSITGSSSFTREFSTIGPSDKAGRSLRDFDLTDRLFKYPCSYLIYSESFAALPEPARHYIYQRLYDVLSGKDTSADFSHLSHADRKAIYAILQQTMGDLPSCWK